jgi:hypothetical protein
MWCIFKEKREINLLILKLLTYTLLVEWEENILTLKDLSGIH